MSSDEEKKVLENEEQAADGNGDATKEGEPAKKDDLEKLPVINLDMCGLPTVDKFFGSAQEVIDLSTKTNDGIIESVNNFVGNISKPDVDFGEDVGAADEDDGPKEGTIYKLKQFVKVFIKMCKNMLSDISTCMPQIDIAAIKDGKLKIIWPTFNFDKLPDELRPKAQKAWEYLKDMITKIQTFIEGAIGKAAEQVKTLFEECKSMSVSGLASEAKAKCSGFSEASTMASAAMKNLTAAKNNLGKLMATLASNATAPLMAVMTGFKNALRALQNEAFANGPEVKGVGLPKFDKKAVEAVDPNAKIHELPAFGVNTVGIEPVDVVFAKLKGLFDVLVDANNKVIAKAKEVPGSENGAGLKDSIASAVFDAKEAMQNQPKTCFCLGGGPPAAKVDASWKKMKTGDIKVQLPDFDLSNLSDTAKAKVEKLIALAKYCIEIIKEAFKAVPEKCKELVAEIKKFTPKEVKKIAEKEFKETPEKIPLAIQMFMDNCTMIEFIGKTIACFFQTFTTIIKAIQEGFLEGKKAIAANTPPKGKAPDGTPEQERMEKV